MTDENLTPEPAAIKEPIKKPEPAPEIKMPKIEKTAPNIQKRGGISFFTALLMSTASMVGGAYLSLFIGSRPDLIETYKLGAILPRPSFNNVATPEIMSIRAELKVLQTELGKLTPQGASLPPAAALPNPSSEVKVENTPSTNQAASLGDGAPKVAASPSLTAPLQNTQPPQQIANLEPLKEQINGLSGRLTAIETRLAALDPTGTGGAIIAALQAEIATLKVNFENLNTRVSQTPSPAITFAVMSLAEATNRSGAFIPEFAAVKAALPNIVEVAALEPISRIGAPTRAILEKEFETLNITAQAAQKAVKNEGGFVGWVRALFANMIKVEVQDKKPDPNAPTAVFERAKIKLLGGDLNGAVLELETIELKSPELAKWLEGAKARIDLEAKVAALRGAIERGINVSPISSPSILAAPTQIPQSTDAKAPIISPPQVLANPTNSTTNQVGAGK